MDNGSANAPGNDASPSESWREASRRLAHELDSVRERLRILESPVTIRAQYLELTDDQGAVRLRLGYLGDEDLVGLECLRGDGTLSAFFGQIAGEGSVMFTGGRYDNIVVDFGATEHGGHLRVVDAGDPIGSRSVDALGEARLAATHAPS